MIAGAAGDDAHIFDLREDGFGTRAKCRIEQATIGHTLLQGVGHGARLLMYFFEHEVAVRALLGSLRRQLAFFDGPFDDTAFCVQHFDRMLLNLSDIAFFQEHEAARHRQQGRDVRGHIVTGFGQADNHGATHARQNQTLRVVFAQHYQRISAFQLCNRGAHSQEQLTQQLHVIVNAVGNDFCVGL